MGLVRDIGGWVGDLLKGGRICASWVVRRVSLLKSRRGGGGLVRVIELTSCATV